MNELLSASVKEGNQQDFLKIILSSKISTFTNMNIILCVLYLGMIIKKRFLTLCTVSSFTLL